MASVGLLYLASHCGTVYVLILFGVQDQTVVLFKFAGLCTWSLRVTEEFPGPVRGVVPGQLILKHPLTQKLILWLLGIYPATAASLVLLQGPQ